MITSTTSSPVAPLTPNTPRAPKKVPTWTVETDKCEIDFDVPRLVDPLRSDDAEAINAAVGHRFDKARTNFTPSPDAHSTLSGSGSVVYDDGHLTAVSLSFDEYAGGAHPNPWLETVLYDADQHREVKLEELFKDRGSALDDLSRQLGDALKTQPDVDEYLIATCASPQAENLAAFHPSDDGLSFALPGARSGPVGAGMFEATLPWGQLRESLDPSGALWRESAPFTWSLASDEARASFTRLVSAHRTPGAKPAADPKEDDAAPEAARAYLAVTAAARESHAPLPALTEQYAQLREALGACRAANATADTFAFIETELRNGTFGTDSREQVTARFIEGLGLTGKVDDARAYTLSAHGSSGGTVENGDDAVVIGGIRIPKKA